MNDDSVHANILAQEEKVSNAVNFESKEQIQINTFSNSNQE